MLRTVVRAGFATAILASETSLAETCAVFADSIPSTVIQASLEGTVFTHPTIVTLARLVLATPVSGAIVGANFRFRTVKTLPPINTLACAVVAQAMATAVSNTCAHSTVISLVTFGTIAGAVLAITLPVAVLWAGSQPTVETGESVIAMAREVSADTIARAVVRAYSCGAIRSTVSGVAPTLTSLTKSMVRARVRTVGLRAIQTTESIEAAASSVKAATMGRAVVGALARCAIHPLESLGTLALAVNADTPHGAVVGAQLGLAGGTDVALVTHTRTILGASTAVVTVVGALWLLASHTRPATVAVTATGRTLIASTSVGALLGAPFNVTVDTGVHALLTDAHIVFTVAVVAGDAFDTCTGGGSTWLSWRTRDK